MKLTTVTQVSVDGVMQANGPSAEEHAAGFERDGWAMGHFDSEAMTFVDQLYQRADAFLFGRWTYDFFAGYWGAMDPGSGPIADALNTRPKYVASTTLTDPRQRPAGPLAARERPRRRAESAHRPGGRRPGHAPVSRLRPGHSARPDRIARLPEGRHAAGLPADRAPDPPPHNP